MNQPHLRTRYAFLVVGVAGLLAGPAWAGAKSRWPLKIDLASSTVQGSLATVRASRDTTSLLACEVNGISGAYGGNSVNCWAQDAAGVFASCTSNDPVMITAMSSLNNDSLIRFSWDAAGKCTYLTITNVSWGEPKVP
jgi:hypothetical protein